MLKYTFFLLFAVFGATTAVNNVTKCYSCDDDKGCIDPFDEFKGSSVECSSLKYNETDTKTSLRSVVLKVQSHERNTGSFVFSCVKVTGKNNVTRTCFKKYDSISDVCEFIVKESDDTKIVESCSYCDTDNCNSGVLYKASGILMGVILFFMSAF